MVNVGISGQQVWSESGNCALFKCVKSGNIDGINLLLTKTPEDIERKQQILFGYFVLPFNFKSSDQLNILLILKTSAQTQLDQILNQMKF